MSATHWIENLGRNMKADPKKTGALLVLMSLLGLMVGRMVIGKGELRPATAGAAPITSAKPAGGRGAGARSGAGSALSSAGNAAASSAMQKWSDAPVPPVSRNIFAVRIDYFPVDGSRTTQSAGEEDGFWSRLEKSLSVQADQRDKRENLIANFEAKAATLRLQSTMMGPQPKAMVNGELKGEGDVVASFRVLKIEARRMIVEREGIKLEIQMK